MPPNDWLDRDHEASHDLNRVGRARLAHKRYANISQNWPHIDGGGDIQSLSR